VAARESAHDRSKFLVGDALAGNNRRGRLSLDHRWHAPQPPMRMFSSRPALSGLPTPGGGDATRNARTRLAEPLADGGAEEVPDGVCEGEAESSSDDHPRDGAADVASAQPGAKGAGQGQREQDSHEGHRDPEAGRR
jgi:hypothetical protein